MLKESTVIFQHCTILKHHKVLPDLPYHRKYSVSLFGYFSNIYILKSVDYNKENQPLLFKIVHAKTVFHIFKAVLYKSN